MKRGAATLILIELVLGACSAPALQSPLPTPPSDVSLRVESAVTPSPPPAYYYVAGDGSYVPITPIPTQPSPTPLPARRSTVSIYPINSNRLPSIPQDLAFLNADALQVWRQARAVVKPLVNLPAGELPAVGQPLPAQTTPQIVVQAYSIQPGIDKIALRFSYQSRATYVGLYDMKALTITPLGQTVSGMAWFATPPSRFLQFTADGRWLGYVKPDRNISGKAGGKGSRLNAPPQGNFGIAGQVHVVSTDGQSAPIELGGCRYEDSTMQNCDGFVWSPDSTQLAWSDARGIWVAGIHEKARLLQAVNGQMFGMPMTHRVVLSWSPDGRWLLTRDHIQAGASLTLMEVASGRRLTLEQSWMSLWSPQQALWLVDGSLVVAAPGGGKMSLSPALLWYRISDANSVNAIAPWRTVSLHLPPANVIFGLGEHDGRGIGFGVTNADPSDDRSRGIYSISAAGNAAKKLNDLPVFIGSYGGSLPAILTWSHDGAAVIYTTPETALLVSAVDSPLIDLQSLSNQPYASLCCFTWLQ